jgi:hypothetical protein
VDGKASYAFKDGAQDVDGPVQWANAIASSQQAHACYVQHWLEFGLGRAHAAEDAAMIARIGAASHDGESVKELLGLIAQSASFRAHKLEAP